MRKIEKDEFVREYLARKRRRRDRIDREVLGYKSYIHTKYLTGKIGRRTAGKEPK